MCLILLTRRVDCFCLYKFRNLRKVEKALIIAVPFGLASYNPEANSARGALNNNGSKDRICRKLYILLDIKTQKSINNLDHVINSVKKDTNSSIIKLLLQDLKKDLYLIF